MPAEGVVRSILALIIASAAFAANKPSPTPTVKTGNADVELTATLYVDKVSIAQLLGSDMGGYYVVVSVRLAPKNNEKIKVFRDDFQLRTDRDGERSKPFAASQIAGRGALVVTRTYEGGGVAAENGGPVFGGGIGGLGMGGIGNSGGTISNSAKIDSGSKSKESPILASLNEKILPEKEIDQPVSGLLSFPIEPKHTIKDLELIYSGPGSKLSLRFR